MLKLLHNAVFSNTSKVMLKILQARLQQYENCELPDVQAGFRKGWGTRDHIADIHWMIKNQESSRKKSISVDFCEIYIYFSFIYYAKKSDCVDHNKKWKILKKMEYQATWPFSWEIHMQVRKQQLELDMEQQTGSK